LPTISFLLLKLCGILKIKIYKGKTVLANIKLMRYRNTGPILKTPGNIGAHWPLCARYQAQSLIHHPPPPSSGPQQ
jgi:hypothetical protein